MGKNLLKVRKNLEYDYEKSEKPKNIKFAHKSEEEFSKILDFYRINWEYEPEPFPVHWHKRGTPIISFFPDFAPALVPSPISFRTL